MDQDHTQPPDAVGAGTDRPLDPASAGSEPGRDLLGPGTMVVDGRYRLASIVARNGNDTVYSALDERARSRVRLRITAHPPDAELQRLRHPAIPAVLDKGRVGRWYYVVLEWFDGAPLELPAVARSAEPARLRAWAITAMDLLDALEHAHTTSGRAHGDIGLHGLWEGSDGAIRFIDFSGPEGALTAEGVPYASPERLRGQPREPRSDLYSLACVLYALAYGVPPFGTDPIDARAGHLLRQPDPPPSRSSFLTAPFFDILRTALDKQPHHRFASAARMRAAFQVALHDLGSQPRNVQSGGARSPNGSSGGARSPNGSSGGAGSPLSEQVTIIPDPSVLDTVVPADGVDDSTEGETDHLLEGTLDVPPTREFVPWVPPSEVETRLRPPRAIDLDPDEEDTGWFSPKGGAAMVAVGVSILGIAASGVAWLAAVAVLALIASQPEGSTLTSPLVSSSSETLPPIEAAAVRPQPTALVARPAPIAPSPARPEPKIVAPPEPPGATEQATPVAEQVPVAFPANGWEAEKLGPFPMFVDLVRSHRGVVRLTGHTDSRGPEAVNYKMGLGRAWAVQKLLEFAGIEVVRVPIASKGELEPVADNSTAEGRAANRRVTAEFFAPGQVVPEP